jgi:uncharacterized membrane protein YidH (DUF202 family)
MSLRRLRTALAVLSVGFAFEGGGELYTLLTPGAASPGETALFLFPTMLAVLGLILMWAGRDGWTGAQRARAATASQVFGASVLCGLVAAGVVVGLTISPSLGLPWWAPAVFGGSLGGLVLGTTVAYGYLLYDLVARPIRAVILAAVAWSLAVSAALAVVLAANLGTVLATISAGATTVPPFAASIDGLLSYLFGPFFLLLAATLQAQFSLARRAPTRANARGSGVVAGKSLGGSFH